MIIDKLENISNYVEIPDFAIEFVNKLASDLKEGRYNLENDCFANIESYNTKLKTAGRFEAHRNFADIQILVSGTERIYYTGVNGLHTKEPYNDSKDIEFFADSIEGKDFVTLDCTNFVMLYPHEAHAPQIAVFESQKVKKVVLKIKI